MHIPVSQLKWFYLINIIYWFDFQKSWWMNGHIFINTHSVWLLWKTLNVVNVVVLDRSKRRTVTITRTQDIIILSWCFENSVSDFQTDEQYYQNLWNECIDWYLDAFWINTLHASCSLLLKMHRSSFTVHIYVASKLSSLYNFPWKTRQCWRR